MSSGCIAALDRDTASRKAGIAADEEMAFRRHGVAFTQQCARLLDLPARVAALACTYLHLFYEHRSIRAHDTHTVCATCLFISSKAGEAPRRPRCVSRALFCYSAYFCVYSYILLCAS
jgi:hypothetical protein